MLEPDALNRRTSGSEGRGGWRQHLLTRQSQGRSAGRAGRIIRPAELPDRLESLGLSPHERVGWEGQVKPLDAPVGCLLRLTPHLVEANDPLQGQALPNRGDVG